MDSVVVSNKNKSKWIIFATICVLLILVQISYYFILSHYLNKWENRGQFGDIFGATNSLFSGIAFAGLIFAILLQQDQMNDQREEAMHSRVEFNDILDIQTHANNLRVITFLLEHYDSQLTELSGKPANGPVKAQIDTKIKEISEKKKAIEEILDELHLDVINRFRRK